MTFSVTGFRVGTLVVTERHAPDTSTPSSRLVPQAPEAPADVRPLSRRRQALLGASDGGAAALRRSRQSAGQLLEAHALAPLIALRLRGGLTQQQVATRSGLQQPHISRIENGQVPNPDAETLRALARGYGCRAEDVLRALDETLAAPDAR